LTAGLFLLLRALAEGVRVFAISIVVAIVLGTGEIPSIILIVCLTLFYTFEGGMTAVIWTDVIQMFLYVAGAIVSLFVILNQIHGGWGEVVNLAQAAGKFQVLDFTSPAVEGFFSRPYSFWAGVVGGCFLTTASHGTEQLMVQRLLAARGEAEARKALFGSWVVIAFQFTLFLLIGLILWVYYQQNGLPEPVQKDRIYPGFIWKELPTGVAGLVVAAILAAAMSNLSAALNSLASTTVMDFYKLRVRDREEGHYLRLARMATLGWGAVLFAIGVWARKVPSVLEAGLGIASILYGGLLGVFLLGVLTRRVREPAAMVGMTAGVGINLYIRFFMPNIAWTWYVLIGTLATVAAGLAASALQKERPGGE
jgi:SSS family transporter